MTCIGLHAFLCLTKNAIWYKRYKLWNKYYIDSMHTLSTKQKCMSFINKRKSNQSCCERFWSVSQRVLLHFIFTDSVFILQSQKFQKQLQYCPMSPITSLYSGTSQLYFDQNIVKSMQLGFSDTTSAWSIYIFCFKLEQCIIPCVWQS